MRPPLIVWVNFAAFLLPVLAGAWRWRSHSRPVRLVAGWYATLLVENLASLAWAQWVDRTNNLLVIQLFLPIEAAFVLPALAAWQASAVARLAARISLPIYCVGWAAAMRFIEDPQDFSIIAGPVLGLLVLVFALLAFIGQWLRDDRPVFATDWGWVLPGLAMFFAINATATIFMSMALAQQDVAALVRAILLRSWIYLASTLLITGGFIWPLRPRSSGVSSSPLPSP